MLLCVFKVFKICIVWWDIKKKIKSWRYNYGGYVNFGVWWNIFFEYVCIGYILFLDLKKCKINDVFFKKIERN